MPSAAPPRSWTEQNPSLVMFGWGLSFPLPFFLPSSPPPDLPVPLPPEEQARADRREQARAGKFGACFGCFTLGGGGWTGVCLEPGGWQGAGGITAASPGLQSLGKGPCSFVYKCRVAFGEQGWGQSVSPKKGRRSGGKEEGLCSLSPHQTSLTNALPGRKK